MARKILVCLDGSELAERILPYAIEQAVNSGARLILLKVCTPTPISAASGVGTNPMVSSMVGEIAARNEMEQADRYLKEKATELADQGLEVDVATTAGSFAQCILQFIKDNAIDLVAMTAHSYKGWKRLLRGSAFEDILRESHVPLLILNSEAV